MVVAVANASSIGWVAVVVSMVAAVAVLAVQKVAMSLPLDGWRWRWRWRSKRGCTGIFLIRVLCLVGSYPKFTRCQ